MDKLIEDYSTAYQALTFANKVKSVLVTRLADIPDSWKLVVPICPADAIKIYVLQHPGTSVLGASDIVMDFYTKDDPDYCEMHGIAGCNCPPELFPNKKEGPSCQ